MEDSAIVGIIGVGNIGNALVRGWIEHGPATTSVVVFDRDGPRAAKVATEAGSRVGHAGTLKELVHVADPLIVATKPQDMDTLMAELAPLLRPGQKVVSTAAGVTLARLRASVGSGPILLRMMPNMAVGVGQGVVALAGEEGAGPSALEAVSGLLEGLGTIGVLPEEYFDVVTAVTGSGPGFLAVVLEGLEDGAVRAGLPRHVARPFVRQMALGTSRLLLDDAGPAGVLKDQVSSPGGTTMAGLAVLEDRSVRGAMIRAVEAAVERGRQL
ncbi:MAG: pyrroline-5-carboxylate reductase [Actinobacteria bacterium]|nr:pyrroline-5-carboxylate reductase [Actinomycetota bacterium]